MDSEIGKLKKKTQIHLIINRRKRRKKARFVQKLEK